MVLVQNKKANTLLKKENSKMDKCFLVTLIKTGFPHRLFNSIVLTANCIMAVTLNFILITAFVATKEAVKNTSNLLILCVCLADFIYGAAIMPLFVYILNNLGGKGICTAIQILFAVGGSLANSSAMLKTLIAVDRFLHMNPNIQNQPSKLHRIFKTSNIGYVVISVIIMASTISGLGITIAQSTSEMMLVLGPGVVFGIAVYVSIVTGLYIKGYKRIRTFTEDSPVYQEVGEQPHYVKNLYKTVLVLVLLLCVSYIPYCIAQGILYILVNMNVEPRSTVYTYFVELFGLLTHTSYFTNCLVVIYFNKKAKSWIYQQCRICARQQDNHEIMT